MHARRRPRLHAIAAYDALKGPDGFADFDRGALQQITIGVKLPPQDVVRCARCAAAVVEIQRPLRDLR